MGARIIAVCDAFDAMTSVRPYSDAMSVADALAELHRHSGTQFDPGVVSAFDRLTDEFKLGEHQESSPEPRPGEEPSRGAVAATAPGAQLLREALSN